MIKILILLYILPAFLMWSYIWFWERSGKKDDWKRFVFMPLLNLAGYFAVLGLLIILIESIFKKLRKI